MEVLIIMMLVLDPVSVVQVVLVAVFVFMIPRVKVLFSVLLVFFHSSAL